MVLRRNTLEAGTNGTIITTANSAGGPYADDGFDGAVHEGTSTLVYDNVHAAHRVYGAKIQTGIGEQAFLSYVAALGTLTEVFGRVSFYAGGAPLAAATRIARCLNGTALAAAVQIGTGNKVNLINAAGVSVATSVNSIPNANYFRLEWHFVFAPSGLLEVKIFTLPDDVVPLETLTVAADTGTQATNYLIGRSGVSPTGPAVGPFWVDDIAWSTTGYVGPFMQSVSPAGIPTAEALGSPTIAQVGGANQSYAWAQSGVHGGGFMNTMDVSPFTDGNLVAGCDVGGIVASADHGGTWATRSKGMFDKADRGVASMAYYSKPANAHKVLAFTGNSTVGAAKVWLSRDEGMNWTLQASGGAIPVVHSGNNAGFPGLPDKHPRATGRYVAIDESTGITYIYAAGHHNGIWRSTDDGATWTPIGLQEAGGHRWYIRSITLLPNDPTRLLVGTFGVPAFPGDGGAYQLSAIRGASPTVLKLPSAPDQVEEFCSVTPEMIVYAACGDFGLYRVSSLAIGLTPTFGDITNGLTKSCGWSAIASPSPGTTIYAGCANPISTPDLGGGAAMFINLVRSTNGGAAWTPLTNDSRNISFNIVGTGVPWWLATSVPSMMLGKGTFVAAQIVVNPLNSNEVWVCGRSGLWRSTDAGVHWFPAVNRMNVVVEHAMRADPSVGARAYAGDTDWGSNVTADKWVTITNRNLAQGGFAAAIDPSVNPAPFYVGGGNRDTNDGGEIQRFNNPVASGTFSAMGLAPATTAAFGVARRPMGLAVRDIASAKVIVAAVDNGGIWRYLNGNWTNVVPRTLAMSADLPQNAEISVVWVPTSPFVFVYDKEGGIWRSPDNGVTWTKIWSLGNASFPLGGFVEFTGYMCADPSLPGRLFISTSVGLYRITDARTGSVDAGTLTPTNLGLSRTGNLDTDSSGNLYVVRRPSAGGVLAGLMRSKDHGATFADISDDTFRQAGMYGTGFSVGASGDLYLATQGMGILAGVVTAPAATTVVSPVGIPSGEALGFPTIVMLLSGSLTVVQPAGIASAAAVGTPTLVISDPPVIDERLSYFLPPPMAELKYPPLRRLERMGITSARYRALLWTYGGRDEDGIGGITIEGVSYRGGYWAGPLTPAEVTAITAAGFGDRIVLATEPGLLPANIE